MRDAVRGLLFDENFDVTSAILDMLGDWLNEKGVAVKLIINQPDRYIPLVKYLNLDQLYQLMLQIRTTPHAGIEKALHNRILEYDTLNRGHIFKDYVMKAGGKPLRDWCTTIPISYNLDSDYALGIGDLTIFGQAELENILKNWILDDRTKRHIEREIERRG